MSSVGGETQRGSVQKPLEVLPLKSKQPFVEATGLFVFLTWEGNFSVSGSRCRRHFSMQQDLEWHLGFILNVKHADAFPPLSICIQALDEDSGLGVFMVPRFILCSQSSGSAERWGFKTSFCLTVCEGSMCLSNFLMHVFFLSCHCPQNFLCFVGVYVLSNCQSYWVENTKAKIETFLKSTNLTL